jgi:hypothetical protein
MVQRVESLEIESHYHIRFCYLLCKSFLFRGSFDDVLGICFLGHFLCFMSALMFVLLTISLFLVIRVLYEI